VFEGILADTSIDPLTYFQGAPGTHKLADLSGATQNFVTLNTTSLSVAAAEIRLRSVLDIALSDKQLQALGLAKPGQDDIAFPIHVTLTFDTVINPSARTYRIEGVKLGFDAKADLSGGRIQFGLLGLSTGASASENALEFKGTIDIGSLDHPVINFHDFSASLKLKIAGDFDSVSVANATINLAFTQQDLFGGGFSFSPESLIASIAS
jgi:hypothetical protein